MCACNYASFLCDGVRSVFEKERISAEAQKNLGLESVEDLVVITNEMYRRAGVKKAKLVHSSLCVRLLHAAFHSNVSNVCF